MKLIIKCYKIILLLNVLLFCTSFKVSHPIKLTSSLIEYNPETTRIEMECRVFIDDFVYSINDTLTKNINLSNLSEEDKKGIEAYFEKHFVITINDKKFPLKYRLSKVMEEYNVFSVKFSEAISAIKKGDQICISNTLFFKEYDFLQSNKITVRIPPFITENYFEATSDNDSLSLNL